MKYKFYNAKHLYNKAYQECYGRSLIESITID